jgi:hypothetical protein
LQDRAITLKIAIEIRRPEMLEEKKAELFSSASGQLVRSGALYDMLQQWRTFSKAQTAIFFVKYDGKIYAGDAVERLEQQPSH